MALRNEKSSDRASTAEKILSLNNESVVISSIPCLIKELKERYNIEKKPWELSAILKEDLGMRYRRIKGVTMNTNCEKNLVLR